MPEPDRKVIDMAKDHGPSVKDDQQSPIGTLVERSTRFVLLFKLSHHDSATVTEALARHIQTLPAQLVTR